MNWEVYDDAFEVLKYNALQILRNTDFMNDSAAQNSFIAIAEQLEVLGYTIADAVPLEMAQAYFYGYNEFSADDLRDIYSQVNKGTYVPVSYDDIDSGSLMNVLNRNGELNTIIRNQIHLQAIQELVDDTLLDLESAIKTAEQNMLGSISNSMREIQSGIAENIIRGTSKDEIAKRVMSEFVKDGFTGFITKDGRKLPIDYYSKLSVFTKLSQAQNRGHLRRFIDDGFDLVQVMTNDPTCEECSKHRNMFYSISGDDNFFPELPEELIPLHPHCQCSYIPISMDYLRDEEYEEIIERVKQGNKESTRDEEEKELYDDMQRARSKANAEKKLYYRMQSHLGADMPKTLGAFRRMKRQGTVRYQELYSDYLSSTHTVNR